MKKRGVGPLLAAVLLIAFTIAFAAIISTYLIKKSQEFDPGSIAEESVYCESVTLGYTVLEEDVDSFGITQTSGVSLLGPLTLINKGTFSIQQIIVTAEGYPSNPYPLDPLEPGENNKKTLALQINPDADEIKIIPVIEDIEKEQPVKCVNRQLVINYIQLCLDVNPNDNSTGCR